MTQANEVIAFDSVSKSYGGGGRKVLDGVSLAVSEREFLAIVGPSGSGKTTLLRLVNRLIDPSEGTVRVTGEDVRTVDPIVLRRRIGYVFQGIGLFPHMRVRENIGLTPQLLGWPEREIAARIHELLELVSLPQDYGSRFPGQLSGGERQRVSVARALAARPRIVLMDEPFGALDPITRDTLGTAYRALHDKLGLTTIMVTHDVQEAVLLADRIVVMKAGRILADDTPRHLMVQPSPDVAALMAMPKRQADRIRNIMDGNNAHG